MNIKTDTHFQSPFIETEPVARPAPSIDPVSIEYDSVEDLPTEYERGVGFSGGNDSLVATHKAMSEGLADFVVHIDTGTNMAETVSWVRETCERYGWPLIVVPTTVNPERWFSRYGPPDSGGHNSAFWALKGRALNQVAKQIGEFELITGVYQRESEKRIKNVNGEYNDPDYCNWVYRNIVWDWIDTTFDEYIAEHGLERSPVKKKIHRGGDCQCLAYGHRDEIYVDIEAKYPDDFDYLRNIERRMQEYRGRLLLVEDEYPALFSVAKDDYRTRGGKPYDTLDTVIRKFSPSVFEWATDIDREMALRRGRMVASNYFGHGKLSNAEAHGLVTTAEIEAGDQAELCEYGCERVTEGESMTVERAVKRAQGRNQNHEHQS